MPIDFFYILADMAIVHTHIVDFCHVEQLVKDWLNLFSNETFSYLLQKLTTGLMGDMPSQFQELRETENYYKKGELAAKFFSKFFNYTI